jgi:hypothetical protein
MLGDCWNQYNHESNTTTIIQKGTIQMIYYVIDCEFNRTNYPELIGSMPNNPPAYAIVKLLPDPFREHSCWECDNIWMAKVELNNNTPNLSSEKAQYCPKCNQKSSCSSSWIQSDTNPYPFPEPIYK